METNIPAGADNRDAPWNQPDLIPATSEQIKDAANYAKEEIENNLADIDYDQLIYDSFHGNHEKIGRMIAAIVRDSVCDSAESKLNESGLTAHDHG